MTSRLRLRLIAVALCLALLALYVGTAQPSSASASSVPAFSHVFEIVLENHEISSIIGSSSAPYINSLAQTYGLASNYYGVRHPSLPNYLALVGGDTFGITTNCNTCYINAPTLADQVEASGRTWKAYIESMPKPCYLGDAAPLYKQKHNPLIYFNDIRTNPARCSNIVPFTQFDTDLAANNLPNYVWITPNMCNSMHDCSVSTGDKWVKTVVSKILASPAWKQNGVLFITFDEGSTDTSCCQLAAGGQVVTLVISPLGKPAYTSSTPYSHYSLLRTIEDAWGLPPLANAACNCSAPMAEFFTSQGAPTVTPTVVPTNSPTVVPTNLPTATATALPTATMVPTATTTPTTLPTDPGVLIASTFAVRADTFASRDRPTTSWAASSQLQAVGGQAEKRSFLGFSVAGMPADAQVVSATLRLTVANDSSSGGSVYALSDVTWPETLTWNTQPVIDGPQLATLGPVALGSVVDIDVTAAVHGNGQYSFAIVAPAGSLNTVGYASSSNINASWRPQLIVKAQVPVSAATPAPGDQGATPAPTP
jgi:acid phosphatase